MQCSICKKNTHLLDKCPQLHYVCDQDFIIKKYLNNGEQKRGQINRRCQKFNTFKNITKIQDKLQDFLEQFQSSDSCNEDDSFNAPSNLNLSHEINSCRPETTLQNFGDFLLMDESSHGKLKQSNDDDEKEENKTEFEESSIKDKMDKSFENSPPNKFKTTTLPTKPV